MPGRAATHRLDDHSSLVTQFGWDWVYFFISFFKVDQRFTSKSLTVTHYQTLLERHNTSFDALTTFCGVYGRGDLVRGVSGDLRRALRLAGTVLVLSPHVRQPRRRGLQLLPLLPKRRHHLRHAGMKPDVTKSDLYLITYTDTNTYI